MSDPNTRLPITFYLRHVRDQTLAMLLVGVSLTIASEGSWIAAIIDASAPVLVVPSIGTALPLRVILLLLGPLALGIPLAMHRLRAPLVLWFVLMVSAAASVIIESDRLNWFAFFQQVSFRLLEGPVPLRRSLFGLIAAVAAVAVVSHQSILNHLHDLAGRGIHPTALQALAQRIRRLEHVVLVGTLAFGTILLLVAKISMEATEGAPNPGGDGLGAWLAVAVTLAVATAALAWGVREERAT